MSKTKAVLEALVEGTSKTVVPPLKGKGARSPKLAAATPGARPVILQDPTGKDTEPLFDTLGDPRLGTPVRMPDGRIFSVKSKSEKAIVVHATKEDLIYNGALEVARRYATTEKPGELAALSGPEAKTKRTAVAGPKLSATPPPPEMIEWIAGAREGRGACDLIRAVAKQFPDAPVGQIKMALPDLNPGTVAIQTKKARAA